MLSNVLGAIMIITGILWLIRPRALQNRLKRKLNRKLKWIVYGFIIVFGFLIVGSVIRTRGLLPKIIAIIGMFIVIKGILLVMSKASERMLDWLSERSLNFYRISALSIFAIGIMLILA